MKIAQVAPFYEPHIGGVESHVKDIAEELVKRGHKVHVITSQYEKGLKEREIINGVVVKRVKPLFTAFSTPVCPHVSGEIDGSFDIVHAHSPPPFSEFFAIRTASHLGIPSVVTYHCDLEIPLLLGPIITKLYRTTLGHYTLTAADRIVVTTRSYAATSQAVWRFHPRIVPNMVDAIRFNPENDGSAITERHGLEGKRVALYVGRVVLHKGLEYFIDSAVDTGDDVVHVIVGDGSYMDALKARVRRKGLDDKVVFAGRVDSDDLPGYYAASDVFVLPSISRLEAFGIVTLEAMSTAKPVVLSNIPGVRDVVEHGVEGILAEPMDSKDVARKINTLMDDPDLRKEMGQRGREKVLNEFRLRSVVDSLEELFEEIIRGEDE